MFMEVNATFSMSWSLLLFDTESLSSSLSSISMSSKSSKPGIIVDFLGVEFCGKVEEV